MTHLLRTELGGHAPHSDGRPLLSLLHLSDAHVLDTASPARCEWVEQLAGDPRWRALLPMHRPQEALTHWALAAHVARARREPLSPVHQRPFDLALCTGDNIDNAQRNELDAYLAIMAGGRAQLWAEGGAQQASDELGPSPWPYWCPSSDVADLWKPRGFPAIDDFLARAGAELVSSGLGFPFASLPGNHDFLVQGTALPDAQIARIAVGADKSLGQPPGFEPADPLVQYLTAPALFSQGRTRTVKPLPSRHFVDHREWLQAHLEHGALGYRAENAQRGCADAVIDTEHARIILLDTNHPAGDFQGSLGAGQLAWLDERLAESDRERGRISIVASHHGSASLTNTCGDDPERLLALAMLQVLHRHPSLAAWVVGHRHRHRIRPHPGPEGGFWEITTASIIDWPSQTRAIEFRVDASGQLEICCTLQDHQAEAGSLAALHLDLARRVAGPVTARDMQGQAGDGNVRLLRPLRQS